MTGTPIISISIDDDDSQKIIRQITNVIDKITPREPEPPTGNPVFKHYYSFNIRNFDDDNITAISIIAKPSNESDEREIGRINVKHLYPITIVYFNISESLAIDLLQKVANLVWSRYYSRCYIDFGKEWLTHPVRQAVDYQPNTSPRKRKAQPVPAKSSEPTKPSDGAPEEKAKTASVPRMPKTVTKEQARKANLPALQELIVNHFKMDEIAGICFQLKGQIKGLLWEDIKRNTITSTAQELAEYMERRSSLHLLINHILAIRPNITKVEINACVENY